MATNSSMDVQQAQADLDSMRADRLRLAGRLDVSWSLMAAAGAAMAWFVADAATADPGASYRAGSGWLLPAAVLCLVAHSVRRETGVRFRRLGIHAVVGLAALLAMTLVMFSIALAIVATGHRAWVAVPVLFTWILGALGSAAVFKQCARAVVRV